jgi:hypothetical protein
LLGHRRPAPSSLANDLSPQPRDLEILQALWRYHDVLPKHRELFTYLDDERRLRADVRDLYERQANQAAIVLLAQGDRLRREADDSALTIDLIDRLASRFQGTVAAGPRPRAE